VSFKVKIYQDNPVYSRVDKEVINLIRPCLFYKKVYWRQGQYKKERADYKKYVISNRGRFLSGFIPRVLDYCYRNTIIATYLGFPYKAKFFNPHLKRIEFRDDQLDLISNAIKEGRGIIKAPTGSGKTIIMLGILSGYNNPKPKVLILCHTLTLVKQLIGELVKYNFVPVREITGGSIETTPCPITVATMQSFIKQDLPKWRKFFDIVIVDECHHVSSFSGTYAKILTNIYAPVRFGFTATLPTNDEAKMALEGHIGKVIGELTIQEAAELNILAKPKIKFIKVPFSQQIKDLKRYADVYQFGIVENKARNRLILKTVKGFLSQGKTILIHVIKIEHGKILKEMGKLLYNINMEFVQGSTEGEARDEIRKLFNQKKIKCVVTTAVWKEGVDIPSLDVIVNACGGKSEVQTLQTIGRGLRKTKDKDKVIIVDFLDLSHYYLTNHLAERLGLYSDLGWL